MPIEKFSGDAFRLWRETTGSDITSQSTDGMDIEDGDWQNYVNSQPTREEFTHAYRTGDGFVTVCVSGVSYWSYGVEEVFRECLIYSEEDFQLFIDAQVGGGGMSCEQMRECTIDFLEETPLIAEEPMLRDDEDFILWQYKPPETYNELLEQPFDIPFRRMSDIVAMLQVIHHQLNEIIVIQRSEVVGAAFPEWNQVRIENRRPVGIFQACELLPDGKLSGAHYQIQIPWMIDNPEIFLPQVFWIEAGSIQYLRVFEDNSRICLYVATEEEGLRVVDILTSLMEPSRAEIYTDRPTPVRGGTVEEKYKILKYLSYYEGGIKKTRGKWSRLVLDAASFEYPPGFTPVES